MLQSATTLTVYNTTVPQEEMTATIEQQCRMVFTHAREGDKSLVSVKMMFTWYDCGRSGSICRAGATSPVGQVSTGPLFSPSALTADLGDYDVRGSIDERNTGSTELAA